MPISLSTLADQVGGCTAALEPLFKRLEAYVLSAERLHGDDTTVPVLAKGKTDTGRIKHVERRRSLADLLAITASCEVEIMGAEK